MRVHACLFGILAAASGTLAKKGPPPVPCSDQRNTLRYDESLQYLTDSMNGLSAELASLNQEFNIWNGHNRGHMGKITESQARILCWATVAVEAWNDAEFTPQSLTPEQQSGLPTTGLLQNMIAYADLMKRDDSQAKWKKWKDSKKNDPTATAWLDSSKQSLDQFLFTLCG